MVINRSLSLYLKLTFSNHSERLGQQKKKIVNCPWCREALRTITIHGIKKDRKVRGSLRNCSTVTMAIVELFRCFN